MTDSPLNKLARQMLRDLDSDPGTNLPAMSLAMKALEEPEEAGLEFPELDLWLEDALLLEASDLAVGKSPAAIRALEPEGKSLQATELMLLQEIKDKSPMEAAGILAARLYRSLRPTLEPRQD